MNQTHTGQPPVTPSASPSPVLDRFRELFNNMSATEAGPLSDVYHADIQFTDPLISVTGLTALEQYFGGAYANVIKCRFNFLATIAEDDDACLTWKMDLRHKRIRRGQLIQVDGISRLRLQDDRIIMHRDYFDAGQLLYENLPVLGSAVRWLRKHAA